MEKIGNSESSFFSFFEPFFAANANLTKKLVKFEISIKNAVFESDFGLEK
jgi:hypothetical protein